MGYEKNEQTPSGEAVDELAWCEDLDFELLVVDCVQVGIAADDRVRVAGGRERDEVVVVGSRHTAGGGPGGSVSRMVWVARPATNRSASSVERYFRRRGRLSTLVTSPSSCGEVTRSSRPSSAASRIRTEGAFGERASAAEISTFASATTRSIHAAASRSARAALSSSRASAMASSSSRSERSRICARSERRS